MDDQRDNFNNSEEELEQDTVTLTLEDGSEVICDVLAIFPCADKEYIALLPQDAGEEGEVFLYQFVQKGEDDIDLINIENDDEFEAVSDAFDELLDAEEFDEMFDDEEEEEESEDEQ